MISSNDLITSHFGFDIDISDMVDGKQTLVYSRGKKIKVYHSIYEKDKKYYEILYDKTVKIINVYHEFNISNSIYYIRECMLIDMRSHRRFEPVENLTICTKHNDEFIPSYYDYEFFISRYKEEGDDFANKVKDDISEFLEFKKRT